MWLKALDMCLEKLRIDGVDFSEISCLSGCAQQHGSVWWRRGSEKLLKNLKPEEYLHEQLVSAFSLRNSPIWMDSSTTKECEAMEKYVGGPEVMACITGSRAYERFTGPQIAKVYATRPEVFDSTERITLISNFMATIFSGSYAPLEVSDASGMNMMDLDKKNWSQLCLEAVLAGKTEFLVSLKNKLGCQEPDDDNIIDTHEIIGTISPYFVDRFGFSENCIIAPFTGDNPGSFAGLRIANNEVVISLGTSDTACFWLDSPKPQINGHILRNPLDPDVYMGLVCQKNASFTRQRIRDTCASSDWDKFSSLLDSVPRGNFGNIGFYFDLQEIYPLVQGDFRYNNMDQRVQSFSPELEIRACVEGQFLRLYQNIRNLGFDLNNVVRILVTGGASTNKSILQVISDIFRLPIYTIDMPNSACLGAAYLAKYAYEKNSVMSLKTNQVDESLGDDENIIQNDRNLIKVVEPTPIVSVDVYKSLMIRADNLINIIAQNNP